MVISEATTEGECSIPKPVIAPGVDTDPLGVNRIGSFLQLNLWSQNDERIIYANGNEYLEYKIREQELHVSAPIEKVKRVQREFQIQFFTRKEYKKYLALPDDSVAPVKKESFLMGFIKAVWR